MSVLDKFAPSRRKALDPNFSVTGFPHTTYQAQRQGEIGQAYADVGFCYEIISDLAVSGSRLPLKVFQISSSGERSEDMAHPAYKLLRRPNPVHEQTLFFEILFASRLVWGEWFVVKVGRDKARPVSKSNPPFELWPLRPDRLIEVPDPKSGLLLGWMLRVGDGGRIPLLASDVIHNRGYHPSSDYRGYSPIEAMRYQVELGRDAEQAAIELYQNGMFTRGVLKVQRRAGAESMKRIAAEFRELMIGSGRRWRIPILEEGMEFQGLQLNPQDAQWLETVKLPRSRLAAAYGYPLPEDYDGIKPEEMRRAKYAGGVQPLVVSMEHSLEAQYFSDFSVSAFGEFQLSHILDADFPTQISAYKEAILSGQMKPNEVRRKLNLPPEDGGDRLYVPLNMTPIVGLTNPPRTRDSAGGMGGDEGRTGARTGDQAALPQVQELKARRLEKLSEALERRLRGVLKREREQMASQKAARDVQAALRASEPEVRTLVQQFVSQAVDAGAEDLKFLLEVETDTASVMAEVAAHAGEVAEGFTNQRGAELVGLLARGVGLASAYDGFGEMAHKVSAEAVQWGYERASGISPAVAEVTEGGSDMDSKLILAALASKRGEPVHVHMPEVRYEPEVTFVVPEVKAPDVNVQVEPPQVNVEPPQVVVNVPEPRKVRRVVKRNRKGDITEIEDA
jgi:HK97 family phage portal protein